MHRDITRYLTLLVIVRLLIGAACPAPSPWRRHRSGAFPGRPAGGVASLDDRLMRDVTDRPLPRPRTAARLGPPSDDVTPASRQLPRPRVKAGGRPAPASAARAAAEGEGREPSGTCASDLARVDRRSGSRRGAHRGRRSYERKRGPRRHQRSWTGAGDGLVKISALNIQSLKPKIADLTHELTRFDYDFVVLSETWLKSSVPNRLLTFPGYSLKRSDRSYAPLGHGGVAILFRDSYVLKPIKVPLSDGPNCKLESLWSLFTWDKNRRLIIAALYRPPRRTVAALDADFTLLEQQYQHALIHCPECDVVLAGDLNCDWLAAGPSQRALSDFVSKYSMFHHINVPTFSSGSAIDVIITNREIVARKGTRFCHFSPHLFTRVLISVPRFRLKPRVVQCRSFKRFNMQSFDADLLAVDWSCVFAASNISDAWSHFIRLFAPIVQRHAPVRTVKLRNPSAPPISDDTRQLLADRARALRLWGRGSDRYREANRLARAAFRADKRRHIGHRVSQQGRGSVWRCAADILGSKKTACMIPPTISAEQMNEFFVHVGPRVAAELAAQGPPPSLPRDCPG